MLNRELTWSGLNSHWKCHMQIIFILNEFCVTLIRLLYLIVKHEFKRTILTQITKLIDYHVFYQFLILLFDF
jgi:hypothetical protein